MGCLAGSRSQDHFPAGADHPECSERPAPPPPPPPPPPALHAPSPDSGLLLTRTQMSFRRRVPRHWIPTPAPGHSGKDGGGAGQPGVEDKVRGHRATDYGRSVWDLTTLFLPAVALISSFRDRTLFCFISK